MKYPMMTTEWNDITNEGRVRTFQWGDFPELIHIVKTGFKDKYIVVYEDAHELTVGETNVLTKAEVEAKFEITL